MTSISTSDRSSVLSTSLIASWPLVAVDHLHAVALEQAVEREDVADIVIDHQHFAPAEGSSLSCSAAIICCFASGRSAIT